MAQPEDGVTNFYPKIGEYDDWSIWYGYRPIRNINTPEEEEDQLNAWIKEKGDNPLFRFGRQRRGAVDPSAQTEDLGDDSMIASELGIRNLRRITGQLISWSTEDGKNYRDLTELYRNVVSQYNRYAGHVTTNVGGVYEYYKTADQEGAVYMHASKDKQQRAIAYLNDQLFSTPTWLIHEDILGRIQQDGIVDQIKRTQVRYLDRLFDASRVKRVIENEALNGDEAYTAVAMMNDLRRGIFSELRRGQTIDTYRRNLQKAFVEKLGELVNTENEDIRTTDIPSLARGTLATLQGQVRSASGRYTNTISKYHLQDLNVRIGQILDPK